MRPDAWRKALKETDLSQDGPLFWGLKNLGEEDEDWDEDEDEDWEEDEWSEDESSEEGTF
jgi:hypothetical protein